MMELLFPRWFNLAHTPPDRKSVHGCTLWGVWLVAACPFGITDPASMLTIAIMKHESATLSLLFLCKAAFAFLEVY
jgi:hypothetical protein